MNEELSHAFQRLRDDRWTMIVGYSKGEIGSIVCARSIPSDFDSIQAGASMAAPDSAVAEFMYMRAGTQTINATRGQPGAARKPVTVQVQVDRDTATALQTQLDAINSRAGDRAYFDFNHEDRDASFWPTRFTWKESPAPGVYVSGEWSDRGKTAINGKAYRSFSPVFHIDDEKNPSRIVCNTNARPNMGGLVNNPAFKQNLPLWAKQAGATQQTNKTSMKLTPEELAKLQARKTQLEQEVATISASSNGTELEEMQLASLGHEKDAIEAKLAAHEAEVKSEGMQAVIVAGATANAEAAIQAAIRRGAIEPKNEALIASWRKKCVEDSENINLLNSIRGKPVLAAAAVQGVQPRISVTQAQITRESSTAVLAKMGELVKNQSRVSSYRDQPKLAKDVAAIYAKEILPRLKEGDDIPINAADTYVSTMVAIRTLELLTLDFPILQSIWTDFSDQVVNYGDTLITRTVGIPTVQTYNTSTGWPSNSTATTADVSITYDQYKGVPIQFQSHVIGSTVRRLFDEVAPAQAYALGKDIVDYIYALITAAYTNTSTAVGLGTFGRSTVIDIGGILDDAANPAMGRFGILARPYYSALAKDNTVVNLAAYQRADLITQGMPSESFNIEGFRLIKAVNLPATSIAGKTLKGFFGTKSSLVLGTRLSADYVNVLPGAGNGTLQVVTTPGGFSANLVQYVNHGTAAAVQRLEVMYGASRGQIAAGALLTDA